VGQVFLGEVIGFVKENSSDAPAEEGGAPSEKMIQGKDSRSYPASAHIGTWSEQRSNHS
jgi:hypothetical protein